MPLFAVSKRTDVLHLNRRRSFLPRFISVTVLAKEVLDAAGVNFDFVHIFFKSLSR